MHVQTCVTCHRKFPVYSLVGRLVGEHCSVRCEAAAIGRPIERETCSGRYCKWCGEAILVSAPAKQKYCSSRCYQAAYGKRRAKANRLPEKSCECCGEYFRPFNKLQLYCGRRCYKAAERARRRARNKAPKRACEHCGEWFQPNNRAHRFCSPKCQSNSAYARRTARKLIVNEHYADV